MLIVLDGWGIAPKGPHNAISLAKTKHFDRISKQFGTTQICASGKCVGLSDGQMGNSEVGHLTIGAGRVIFQDLMRVGEAFASGSLEKNETLVNTLKLVSKQKSTLHLIGLLSNGGVHSHIDHLFRLLDIAKKLNVKNVAIHVILDGRDTPPKSGIEFTSSLLDYLEKLGIGFIATVSGRFYAMDRDNRWERTKLAYDAMVSAKGRHYEQVLDAIRDSYSSGVTDEFLVPCAIGDYSGIKQGDALFFFNFRPDRARQLTKALTLSPKSFGNLFERANFPKNITLLTMTIYDPKLKGPVAMLGREHVPNTLSSVLEKAKLGQLRIAETEKYAHVTYFFNGLVEKPKRYEERILVPSAREVGTYDKKPQMSAEGITRAALKALDSSRIIFSLVNYANADMVGHSGNVKATIKAVETVDFCLGEIYEKWAKLQNKPTIIITADHGNAEKMVDPVTNEPHTAHTANLVPLVLISDKWCVKVPKGYQPGLIDVAPSILTILGLEKPASMKGISIVELIVNKN
ncbi:MAG: 2,3-bisphosphoglycerate-independent phosphoglycerate mutase [Nitrososphaerales archaeon]